MSAMPSSKRTPWILLVFFVALAVRSAYLLEISRAPFFAFLIGDAHAYDMWARRIAHGEWIGPTVFYQAPLYPYCLAAIYRVFGESRLAVAVCQCLAGSCTCAIVALSAWEHFGKRVGIVSGLAIAFYAPAFFFDALIQKSSLDLLLMSMLLWLIVRRLKQPHRSVWWPVGVVLGLLILTRENAAALAPVLIAWSWFAGSASWHTRVSRSALLAGGLVTAIAPALVHNLIAGGGHLTTSQFGPNFHIGNNPNADGTYSPLIPGRGDAEFEREDATRLAENALGRRLSPREVSRYWTGRALSFIRNDTSKWLTLMSRKCCLIANRVEIVDTEDVYAYADFSWTLWLAVPVFQFGFLSALAAGGIVIDGQETRRSNVLIACILAYSGSVILFYVAARYRLPLVPLLIPFAVNGLLASPQFLRRATMPWRAAYIFAVVGMLIASHWKIVDPGRMRAQSYYNFATHFERSGDVRLAVDHYRVALSLNPEHAEAHFNLGNCLAHSRAFEGAKREYEAALALQPGLAAAALNLGNVYCEQGRFQKAMAYFERTLAIEPENARAHNGLGMISAAEGNMVEAIQHFERAILYEPQFKAAYQNLLRAREGQHRPEGK